MSSIDFESKVSPGLQVTTARCVCGTSTVKPASRRSRLTGRRARRPFTTWPSIRPRLTSLQPGPTLWPGSTFNPNLRKPQRLDRTWRIRTEVRPELKRGDTAELKVWVGSCLGLEWIRPRSEDTTEEEFRFRTGFNTVLV